MDRRAAVLEEEYRQRFEPAEHYREAVWSVLCRDFFSAYVPPSATVLDLGAGWGEFTRNIVAARKYAMDLNPECGRRVAGIADFLSQDCADPWPLPDDSLDVVFTSNFLEHLPGKHAVERTLAQARRCLRPGGTMICMGPNIKYLAGPYWDFWDHFIPITEESLSEALVLSGFDIAEKRARFLPYTMSQGRRPPVLALRAYLKMPLVWPLFGRQFLVVARKPASG